MDDHFKVLIIDVLTLGPVNLLDLFQEVLLAGVSSLDP